ncbi:MAG: hypothetical protein CMJ18_00160 [Phycisphaeraceae bacterium]|nr:hypothetical protein [Phycisphaeraceae bacterium]
MAATSAQSDPAFPDPVRIILDQTRPLDHPRGDRLPLLLWPAQHALVDDVATQRRIIEALDTRGVAVIANWRWDDADPSVTRRSLDRALAAARIQQELGLPVCVNANDIMYGFFGSEETAHRDEAGHVVDDPSIPSRRGCPFRIDARYEPMRRQTTYFVDAYRRAGVPLDFVYGDWEIDGPLEINRAWDAARKCAACRRHIPDIESFDAFQIAVRTKRSEATRVTYSEPILEAYPKALVGNYAVYPHDGWRYWLDYFETFETDHPHRMDRRAPCRRWYDDHPLTGYTFAMPVVYPWARTWAWYDFEDGDYRWLYNMLKVGSNAAAHTDPRTPIIPFVHWHTVYEPDPDDPSIRQMSERAYQELLWHLLLRGHGTFFLWCMKNQYPKEVALLHEVWAASLEHAEWLDQGRPITFDVPAEPGTVISGLRLDRRVLVRRTDFGETNAGDRTVNLEGGGTLRVPAAPGRCQVLAVDDR